MLIGLCRRDILEPNMKFKKHGIKKKHFSSDDKSGSSDARRQK